MVSLENELDCVVSTADRFENTFHTQRNYIYVCEHAYVVLSNSELQNVSRTEYMDTTYSHCAAFCVWSNMISL